ncbi:MAG: cytochrome c biogenesis protein CcsA [candidate division Zixibacteria bacterium]|nr:cytochrome c biogenesis protein CcsA [candidate division Zixibacteria bacterium]
MWWKILTFIAMCWVIVAAFSYPAPQQQIGEASRIFYFHVPQAWVSVLAFLTSMIYSIKYLYKGNLVDDDRARAAGELGLVFCILATITGSIFAKITWHSYWNWDPRETSIFILLLIYGAYFGLRSAIEDPERKAKLAAVYAIFAFITVPFLVFIVPRVMPSLHPSDTIIDESSKEGLSMTTRMIFYPALASFSVLFFWMMDLARKVHTRERQTQEDSLS